MSVMSAAEASQAASANPEIPSQPLRIVRSAASQDDPGTAGTRLDAGHEMSAEAGVVERGASALRVTQVRMVREVRVSTLRAGQTRPGIVPRPGTAMRAQAGAADAQVTGPSVTASREWVADQALETGQARVAQQVRVTRQSRVASRARVTSQAREAQRLGPVRLTRRGRRVVAGLVIGVIIVAVTVLWMSVAGSVQASSHGSAQGSPYRGMTQVVVRPGQTLWSIATAAEPSGNLWSVVQQIINVNALSSANVQAGQLLWVPRR
jgi:nucleoid-associated protein YgaU